MARTTARVAASRRRRSIARTRRTRSGDTVTAQDRLHAIRRRASHAAVAASRHAIPLAFLGALLLIGAQAAHAGSIDWNAPLPGPKDFAHVHDQILHAKQGPGIDMTHVALWQLSRRYLLPVWLVWSMLWNPHP